MKSKFRTATQNSMSASRSRLGGPANDRHESVSSSAVIFGVRPVQEALRANSRNIEKILMIEGAREIRLRSIAELAKQQRITVTNVTRDVLTRHAGASANHQGVVAIGSAAEYATLEAILDSVGEDALLVILDGVEDPQNLGAVIRVAEGAGANGVVIPERRAVGLTEAVGKASAGAVEHIPVAKVVNINNLIKDLKKRNIWVVGSSGEATVPYTEWDWERPSAIVLGSEGSGLHRLVAENCDVLVKIPMYGKINSLNVSTAASVILFEAIRQRKNGKGR